MNLQELIQLERLCKQLYESPGSEERAQAEKALVNFTNAADLSKCQMLLERADVSIKASLIVC